MINFKIFSFLTNVKFSHQSLYIYIYIEKREKNSIFLKMGKTVISVENRKFSRSRMTKWTVSLNLSREI